MESIVLPQEILNKWPIMYYRALVKNKRSLWKDFLPKQRSFLRKMALCEQDLLILNKDLLKSYILIINSIWAKVWRYVIAINIIAVQIAAVHQSEHFAAVAGVAYLNHLSI